jgi:hypothetical protein
MIPRGRYFINSLSIDLSSNIDNYKKVGAILDARYQHHFEFATERQSSHSRAESNH